MWTEVLVAIVAVFLAFIWFIRAQPLNVPCPLKCYPIIGCTHEFVRHVMVLPDFLVECAEKAGWKTFGLPAISNGLLKRGPIVIVTPEIAKYVLGTNFENYVKGEVTGHMLADLAGKGIFASDGEQWKFHRKIASNMFTRSLQRTSGEIIHKFTKKLVTILAGHADSHKSVDIQNMLFRLTMDAFGFIAFGVDLNELTSPHSFAQSMEAISTGTVFRFSNPLGPIYRALGLGYEKDIKRAAKIVNEFAYDVIGHKRRDASEGKLGPDLISRFLEGAEAMRGEVISNEELRDVVLNFILAGRDTTAGTMSYTLWELLRHPAVLQKTVSEIDKFEMPEDDKDGLKNATVLPYLHAVLLETLRLHPQVPIQSKFAIKDDEWPDGTKIQAGQPIMPSPYLMGRNPIIWGPNAKEFVPERWLDDNGAPIPEPSAFQFLAFNAGRRICLGKDLAMMEMKIVLVELLQEFEFSEDGAHDGMYLRMLTLPMKGPFTVNVTQRPTR